LPPPVDEAPFALVVYFGKPFGKRFGVVIDEWNDCFAEGVYKTHAFVAYYFGKPFAERLHVIVAAGNAYLFLSVAKAPIFALAIRIKPYTFTLGEASFGTTDEQTWKKKQMQK
jgi:NRPS condensation-like uncharacterized protein